MRSVFIVVLVVFSLGLKAQDNPVHVDNKNIYEFLDELALLQVIDLNNAIKPYSSKQIFTLLEQAGLKKNQLNLRQSATLERYISYYSFASQGKIRENKRNLIKRGLLPFSIALDPPGFHYMDTSVFLSLVPIWGIDYHLKTNGTNLYHRWGGAAVLGRVGKSFSFYANLRDNKESELLSSSHYLFNGTGGNYKGGEYSEMRGGLSYSWKWGQFSLIKDHLEWGTNYNGANILSDRSPSMAQIKFNLNPVDWFDFSYVHAWLVSDVIDSSRSYVTDNGLRRDVMQGKYLAANMYTFKVLPRFHLSFGNSVIYSADNPHPGYLIPFFFYKSIDHWLNSTDGVGSYVGQNSQMFINLSSYNIRSTHIYASLFVDEFKFARVFDDESHNFWSYKIGMRTLLPFSGNIRITTEYTRTNPNTYQHNISTTTFESNSFNLGHYLRDNADEWYLSVEYLPFDRFRTKVSYTYARKGEEYGYLKGGDAIKYAFMEEVRWSMAKLDLLVEYELLHNTFVKLGFQYSNAEGADIDLYTPDFYKGINKSFSMGFRTGI